jgi:hypothetical protein
MKSDLVVRNFDDVDTVFELPVAEQYLDRADPAFYLLVKRG